MPITLKDFILRELSKKFNIVSCYAIHDKESKENNDECIDKEKINSSANLSSCIAEITFTNDGLLLGLMPHNRPLFVTSYVQESE
jgi:hypothetical protein